MTFAQGYLVIGMLVGMFMMMIDMNVDPLDPRRPGNPMMCIVIAALWLPLLLLAVVAAGTERRQ